MAGEASERAALSPLAKAERELYDARVALGVAFTFIPAARVEAFQERLRLIREDGGPEWICVECGSRYVSDVGRCGQLQPFECEGMVVPLPEEASRGS